MLDIIAETEQGELVQNLSISQLQNQTYNWYWVDFSNPTAEEVVYLKDHFHFHPLAIEDCLDPFERPKCHFYSDYLFIILHAIKKDGTVAEIDLFISEKFVITFHNKEIEVLSTLKEELLSDDKAHKRDAFFISHKIMNEIIESYFPRINQLENRISEIDQLPAGFSNKALIEEIYTIRADLLELRHSIVPMLESIERIVHSERIILNKDGHIYFSNLQGDLARLASMIESNREMTVDIRDSFLSMNTFQMNRAIMRLTIIATIFMPLTLLTGIYGMNFDYIPELHWKYAYFIVLGVMIFIVISMFIWFVYKGWLGNDEKYK